MLQSAHVSRAASRGQSKPVTAPMTAQDEVSGKQPSLEKRRALRLHGWAIGEGGGGVFVLRFGKSFRRFRPRLKPGYHCQDGYAAVDALVALMILASTLVCAVSATHGSRMVADAALELRKANDLASYLLETSPKTPSETTGAADGFTWTRTVADPVDIYGAGAICERRVVLIGRRDKRRFEARTSAVCAAALAS